MKKYRLIPVMATLFALTLSGCGKSVDPWEAVEIKEGINLHTYTYDREKDKTIDILIEGYSVGNSVGIFDRDSEPGSAKGAIKRKALKEDINIYSFEIKDFKKDGEYSIFLFDKDEDIVKDFTVIEILDDDETDYVPTSVSLEASVDNGLLNSSVSIETTHTNKLTYYLYWAKDGVRLPDYTHIKTFKSEGQTNINLDFNIGMFAPSEANQIEVTVKEGRSTSVFGDIPSALKVATSTYQNTIQVFSDIHIESKYTCANYNSHFLSNLNLIKNYDHETSGMVFVGDTANTGSPNNYNLIYEYIDSVFENRPTMYPIVGNHELQYFDDYNEAIETYKTHTGMPGAYFSFELAGFKCFALGSEDTTTHGYMSNNQLNWFKTEIQKLDKNEKIMIFMHQGIYNTVSGTLPGHGWHGLNTSTSGIRNVIKNYPNAFVFSGHSHQDLNCEQTSLFGAGEEANYINCGSSAYVLNDEREQDYGSTGYFVDIYEDYMILRGRLSIENKWIAAAQFVVPFIK